MKVKLQIIDKKTSKPKLEEFDAEMILGCFCLHKTLYPEGVSAKTTYSISVIPLGARFVCGIPWSSVAKRILKEVLPKLIESGEIDQAKARSQDKKISASAFSEKARAVIGDIEREARTARTAKDVDLETILARHIDIKTPPKQVQSSFL